ncbi:MAG: ATP-binding protein [Acidimicrobiia bacterium]|nr:ATP-binding protein [Acidimicrobiia bacterium]
MSNHADEEQRAAAAALTRAVLDEEAARQADHADADREVLFADDLLPGVGSESMTLSEGLAKGGPFTFFVLLILNSLDELEGAVFNVLGPDIGDSFGISDGTVVFIGTATIAFFVLGAVPFGWLADRYKRAPLVGVASILFSSFIFLTGLAVNAFMMFWTKLGAGVSKANTNTVHGSLIADTYPIAVRGRLFATTAMFGRAVAALSPLLAGLIATIAGGDEGWRWAFIILGFPVAVFAIFAFRIPEPPRGQWEQKDVLGTVVTADEVAPSMEAAFARLWKIRTLRTVIVAFAAMGFYLFTGQAIMYLYLEERFGLTAGERGAVGSLLAVGVLFVLPFLGRYFDRTYRESPPRALTIIGLLLLPMAAVVPIQYAMPNVALFVIFAAVGFTLTGAAFSVIQPIVQSVVPYKLRGLGSALATSYIFLVGGVGAGLVSALLVNAFGERTAIVTLAIPSMLIGSLLILHGSRLIKNDLSLIVAELREEMDEAKRQQDDPDNIPALQVNNIDFSYGPVQVLFDLGFQVDKGETLALLGTNGAGKSTVLKVICGLVTPERGVVRLNGRTVTFASPEQRARLGIQMLPGGNGVFPSLTIRDNLVIGAYEYRSDPDEVDRRIAKVCDLFPALASRLETRAADLSGGQQQMLALGRVMLHDPEVLVIDELSLGLAPTVVQSLLETIDSLKAAGQTMIIVEQSLNVALAVADRAVFLEKGAVRFEGPAQELAERDDLARAVFLGSEGG